MPNKLRTPRKIRRIRRTVSALLRNVCVLTRTAVLIDSRMNSSSSTTDATMPNRNASTSMLMNWPFNTLVSSKPAANSSPAHTPSARISA